MRKLLILLTVLFSINAFAAHPREVVRSVAQLPDGYYVVLAKDNARNPAACDRPGQYVLEDDWPNAVSMKGLLLTAQTNKQPATLIIHTAICSKSGFPLIYAVGK